jgi:hypothetical protein
MLHQGKEFAMKDAMVFFQGPSSSELKLTTVADALQDRSITATIFRFLATCFFGIFLKSLKIHDPDSNLEESGIMKIHDGSPQDSRGFSRLTFWPRSFHPRNYQTYQTLEND